MWGNTSQGVSQRLGLSPGCLPKVGPGTSKVGSENSRTSLRSLRTSSFQTGLSSPASPDCGIAGNNGNIVEAGRTERPGRGRTRVWRERPSSGPEDPGRGPGRDGGKLSWGRNVPVCVPVCACACICVHVCGTHVCVIRVHVCMCEVCRCICPHACMRVACVHTCVMTQLPMLYTWLVVLPKPCPVWADSLLGRDAEDTISAHPTGSRSEPTPHARPRPQRSTSRAGLAGNTCGPAAPRAVPCPAPQKAMRPRPRAAAAGRGARYPLHGLPSCTGARPPPGGSLSYGASPLPVLLSPSLHLLPP